ncbi:MAG: hypothetical protein LN588_00720 [Rickettsia endosymbiont of Bryobia graminum]|nr:hypothetical protein [Rickettsia endosymbiont of Bryobia graminum]
MTKNIKYITLMIMGLLLLNSTGFASKTNINSKTTTVNKNNTNDELQKIINDFNSYAGKIPVNIREEVKNYRIKIAEINKGKRELYRKISQEAQNYLSEEQKYKKRILALKKDSEGDNCTSPDNKDKNVKK